MPKPDFQYLSQQIKIWGRELGFQQIGIADIDLKDAEESLQAWLANGYHGDMHYMERHARLRAHSE